MQWKRNAVQVEHLIQQHIYCTMSFVVSFCAHFDSKSNVSVSNSRTTTITKCKNDNKRNILHNMETVDSAPICLLVIKMYFNYITYNHLSLKQHTVKAFVRSKNSNNSKKNPHHERSPQTQSAYDELSAWYYVRLLQIRFPTEFWTNTAADVILFALSPFHRSQREPTRDVSVVCRTCSGKHCICHQ